MLRPSAIIAILLAFLLAFLFAGKPAFAQTGNPFPDPAAPLLVTARDIARYPSADTSRQPRVKLTALITFADTNGTIFVRDETGSTFFRARRASGYQPGQTVAIEGIRFPGLYIGGITPTKVTVLSSGPPPEPRRTTLAELSTGRHHYEYVEIEGIGRSLELTGETTATLRLNVEGGSLDVQFDQAPENGDALIDASILVRGLAAGAINDHRQLVYPYLRVSDGNSVSIIHPAPSDPFSIPEISYAALSDAARPGIAAHRVKISGIALGPVIQGSAFIRSGGRALRILTNRPVTLQPGQPVEAIGFPRMGEFSALLTNAVIRPSPSSPETIRPAPLDPRQIDSGALDADLVTLEGNVVQHLESDDTLIIRTATHTLRVLSPGTPLQQLAPGVRARFTGIWLVTKVRETSSGYRATPAEHELWLRSPSDIVILSSPPWWNSRKLSIVLGIVAGSGLLILAWAAMLQRQVARQLEVIESKAQREAMIEERQRIAREFHDTLEQELAGLSLRLDAAAPRVADEKARTLLDQLRHLLFRLQTETRDFVWDLRDESQHSDPIAVSLEKLIDHLQTTTAIPLRFTAAENLPAVPALARHHLLRITRESVNNAIKYSSAKTIRIALDHTSSAIRLTVEDDGVGFDLTERSNASGHFGLQGMKERVRKLGATLDLHSAPGKGTRVEVVLAIGAPA